MAVSVIIGNGDFPRTEYPRYLISSADHVVCCDGAFKTWLRCCKGIFGEERMPDAVVGDMDSISPGLRKRYASLMVHITEQDFNDMTKALLYTLRTFPDTGCIHFIGFSGKREDHTLGNLSLLMEYARALSASRPASDPLSGMMEKSLSPYRGKAPDIDMVSDHSTVFAISDSCELAVGQGRSVSIISSDNSLKIKSAGLVWPTDEVVFDNLWKATLNRAESDMIRLEFNHPSAALIVI